MPNSQPQKRILLGLHGLAETGKTTAALALCERLELRRYVIALPIYQACAAALSTSLDYFKTCPKNQVLEAIGCTKREFLQQMGDAIIQRDARALINLLETRMATDEICKMLNNGSLVEDVRTESEADWIRSKGGLMIHIKNPRAPKAPVHRTEQTLDIHPLDLIIRNEGTRDEYSTQLEHLADLLRLEFGAARKAG